MTDLDDIKRDMLEMHNHVFNEQRRHRDTLEQIRNLLVACLAALLLVIYLLLRELWKRNQLDARVLAGC